MARQHEIVQLIMNNECVTILDGKMFGTLLGELLKMLEVSEEKALLLKMSNSSLCVFVDHYKARAASYKRKLERKTPEGLRLKAAELIKKCEAENKFLKGEYTLEQYKAILENESDD